MKCILGHKNVRVVGIFHTNYWGSWLDDPQSIGGLSNNTC